MSRQNTRILWVIAFGLTLTHPTASNAATYEYDDLGRITKATTGDGSIIEYTYDESGNRLTKDITPGAANGAPDAVDDTYLDVSNGVNYQIIKNFARSLPVIENDTDPDLDAIIIDELEGSNTADHGSVSVDTNRDSITYNPDTGYTGTDSFEYGITDGYHSASGQRATVTVDVIENSAPAAANDATETRINVSKTIDALANDTDANTWHTLTITAIDAQPPNGTATIEENRTKIRYVPDPGFGGTTDTLTYRISDGFGGEDTADAVVTVKKPTEVIVTPRAGGGFHVMPLF